MGAFPAKLVHQTWCNTSGVTSPRGGGSLPPSLPPVHPAPMVVTRVGLFKFQTSPRNFFHLVSWQRFCFSERLLLSSLPGHILPSVKPAVVTRGVSLPFPVIKVVALTTKHVAYHSPPQIGALLGTCRFCHECAMLAVYFPFPCVLSALGSLPALANSRTRE